jgi:cyclophilin family peptidyl-prolyl cis-trans isomerase
MNPNRRQPPIKQFILLVVLVALLTIGAKTLGRKTMSTVLPTPAPSQELAEQQKVKIATGKGDIVIELYTSDAPKTAKNFAQLTQKGYYNGLTFHRVEPGFVIQGGDPKGDGSGGESIYGPTFEDELNPNTDSYKQGYKKGVVAMANRGPNTNGSQFFIMLEDNPDLPKNYTIFGHVTSGLDVVEKIAVGDTMNKVTLEQ